MSRVAKKPIIIPAEIDIKINGQLIRIKGKHGELSYTVHNNVKVNYIDNVLTVSAHNNCTDGWIQAGTTRSILNSMIFGIANEGFVKKLQLVGVGYRVAIKDNVVSLFLGFSHIINYQLPIGITAECPSQTEIILKGINKNIVSQVAADIRSYRRPESYKGKGIRYANEIIRIKEAKKK